MLVRSSFVATGPQAARRPAARHSVGGPWGLRSARWSGRGRRSVAVAVGMTLVGALAVPAADARIVVDKSIAGVRLGVTRAAVEARVGKPRSVEDASFNLDTNLRIGLSVLDYGTLKVTLGGKPSELTDESRVEGLATTDRRERTANGLRVGVSRAVLKRRVRGITCDSWKYKGRTTRLCSKENPGGTGTVTRYAMTAGWRVRMISIVQVID